MIALFRALPLLTQLLSIAGVALLIFGGIKAWEYKNYREGVQAERAATEMANQERIGNAEQNARTRQECVDAFGVDAWDVVVGVCQRQ